MAQASKSKRNAPGLLLATFAVAVVGLAIAYGNPFSSASAAPVGSGPNRGDPPRPETMQTLGVMYPGAATMH